MDQFENIDQPEYSYGGNELAIIGMAGRFPGARDLVEFWHNLKNGVESISFFDDEEVLRTGADPGLINDPHYVKAGGVLEGADLFDASFFGYSPLEAAILDPQQRIFLETAWHALEVAGYNPEKYPGYIGLFAGMGMNTYMLFNLLGNRNVMENTHGYQLTISNDKDFLPTRVSYKLNLRGPSVNVQTACSTSLVAVHLACQSLLNYQCDMALAGGVAIRFPQKQGYLYQEGGIASPDGHCRAFDANAAGTVGGNGVGIVVIKRLEDAYQDGDNILAVIKGSAINNDGSLKVGYTAPSVEGQSEVIAMAQALADVQPESISYIEAHGTGTVLGDPIEITALNKVFQAGTSKTGYCAIGSVKTNVGHLDAAAGITSVIKTTLSLTNKEIPPSINYDAPNPKIDFKNSPFFVNIKLREWETDGGPRRAGISSFGIGGTNAHVIIEEAPPVKISGVGREWKLLPLSARTPEALETVTRNLASYLGEHTELNLADVAYTLKIGRKEFDHRKVVIARDIEGAINNLETGNPGYVFSDVIDQSKTGYSPSVVFMFTGQGAQYVNMAKDLYDTEPLFREIVDLCADILLEVIGEDIRDLLYPPIEITSINADEALVLEAAERLQQTSVTQPALFVIEYALATLLISWGIQPKAMTGHSIGEYVAACLAGVFKLEDALALVTARGRLMQSLPSGSMLSIPLGESDVGTMLDSMQTSIPNVSLAAVNAPTLCVVSGPHDEINLFAKHLEENQVEYRKLRTSHAFHSPMMDPILDEFRRVVSSMELGEPNIPFISNVSGTWITASQAIDPNYWTDHIRNTVRFAQGIELLLQDPAWVFVEVGPGRTLTTLTKSVISNDPNFGYRTVISTIRHPKSQESDAAFLLTSIGKLWLSGIDLDWDGYYGDEFRMRLPLPTYPFERQKYWIEPDQPFGQLSSVLSGSGQQEIKKNSNINQWLFSFSWKRSAVPVRKLATDDANNWLIFANDIDEGGLNHQLVSQLEELKQMVCVVRTGDQFTKLNDNLYQINPLQSNDYLELLSELQEINLFPDRVIHTWSVDQSSQNELMFDQSKGFYSLLYLVQALVERGITKTIPIEVVTECVHEVIGSEIINHHHAPLIGLLRVVTQEHQNLTCRNFDVSSVDLNDSGKNGKIVDNLLSEVVSNHPDRIVAYRGGHRWVQVFESFTADSLLPPERINQLRNHGTYLITGGLGRIGVRIAEFLARNYQANLILLDKFYFLPGDSPSAWQTWLAENQVDEILRVKVNQLLSIVEMGGEIMLAQADVADINEMEQIFQKAEKRFGSINGIIHAAGIVGEAAIKPITELTRDDCETHFQAKLYGTQAIKAIIEDRSLDFCFLQSSLSATLGGLGLGAYAAANSYLDSFAIHQNRNNSTRWISVDWDGWLFDEEKGTTTAVAELSMTPDEGINIFEKLMSIDNIEQLAVSTADLNARYQRWIRIDPDASRDISTLPGMDLETKAKSTTAFPRPKLQTPYVEPRDRLEQSIAETWQKILGIEEIGIHDDFFELGGHSLLATQLVTRMRDTYQVQLPLRRLFESPTVSGIADMIREVGYKESSALQPDVDLSEAVSEQYESLITPVSRDGDLELSYGQQRLWFLDQIEPDSPLYNNFSAISFSGRINIEGIRYSLQKIISRHEILRTTFQEKAGKPVQIIHETMDLPLNYADLSDISGGTRQERVLQLAFEEARRPFDLKTGPLMRVTLLRLTDEEHVVFLTMHHIISDGWSVRVLIEEVGAYYSAFVTLDSENLHQFSLPALKIQYVDYAYWQREWLKQDVQSKQIDYWANHLADRGEGNGNVELFPDRPRPPFQTSNGASIWFEVPPDITRKLTELSQSSGVTLFMTLMAALQALLLRYTGQEDISIGIPIANRNSVEVESLIGFILNTLIIRTDLTGDPTFSELLQRVKTVALEAYAHQDIPFEMLVEALQPERDMSRAPFFQIIFDLQEAPLPSLNLPGLVISPLQVDNGTAKFDLAVSMEMGRGQDKDRLGGFFNYNTDLFNRDTIDRLIKNWLVLLGNVVLDPDEKISKLNILTDAEKRKLILDWNSNLSQFEKSNLIHEQIESQMLHDPKKIALSLIETASSVVGELTYQELDLRANQLANHLLGIGVSRDEIIGVSLRRSTEMVVVLLAVLKAGAAFLPLDPSYPEGRILYMIDDASVKVIITQEEILSSFPVERSDGSKLNLICVDQDDSEIRQAVDSKPDVLIYGDNLAYVIYTSGSTGLPKGVMISHNEFADHCSVILNHFELTSQDRELQFASFNFDQGLEQIFTSLAAGASLFLRGNEIWPGSEFDKIVRDHSLTVVNIPPAYWHQWTQYVSSVNNSEENNHDANYEQLRLVISGGDVMSPETLRLWSDSPMNQARLLNAYGPTETTITATTYDVSVPEKTSSIREEALVPIGRPLPNRTSYILDLYGNPVPIGVPGELYFGGMGLSRGYLKRSELTAEKFVPDPFYPLLSADLIDSDFVGKRLYRTGDLVRYLPDGNIEFLGRFDHQVKLRGFRIELGEIETVLGFHPAVSEAVVVVRQNDREIEGQNASKVDKRLIAYIVLREEQDVSEKELYDYLTNNLPNYMVPSGIMMLNEFPLTPSGKLDRKALPEPDEISSLVDREYIAPRDPIEQELAILWTEILGIEWDGDQSPISILDNFFELGGHSLLATQIISRLRETYHIELPVRRLFEQPTIAGLAYIISESLAEVQTPDDLDELLAELDGLSDEEVRTLLEDDSTKAAGEQS